MPNDNEEMGNPRPSGSEASTTQKAADPVNRIVEGASQLAEDARKAGERYIEEGRRRLPEAEQYYRQGQEAVSAQVRESPLAAMLIAGVVGYFLAYLIHGAGGAPRSGRSDAPPFGRRPPVNEAQRHGMQQDPRERVEISQTP